jgi:predicted deacylase
MEVAGIKAQPGTLARGSIEVVELADGTKISMPVIVINGAKPGPKLYIGAAIHGDEVTSIGVITEALKGINPSELCGQIIAVPVQQPLSLYADHRLPLAQLLKSPLDQSPADAWLVFPGDKNGNVAQRFAAHIFELIKRSDYAIDIHTPTRGGRYVPIAILPSSKEEQFDRVLEFAKAMSPGWIMCNDTGIYVANGVLCVEATRAGVPCFTFELGEGGRLERELAARGAVCVRNAMSWLGMIDAPMQSAAKTYLMREFIGLRAERGGLLYTEVDLGSEVKKGQLLARIVDVFGEEVQRVEAPVDGVFVRETTLSNVASGDRVATLGV